MSAERLAEIEERLSRATPGPWAARIDERQTEGGDGHGKVWDADYIPPREARFRAMVELSTEDRKNILPLTHIEMAYLDNARLIAHAPTDLRWLIGRVRELEADRDRLDAFSKDGVVKLSIDYDATWEDAPSWYARRENAVCYGRTPREAIDAARLPDGAR